VMLTASCGMQKEVPFISRVHKLPLSSNALTTRRRENLKRDAIQGSL